MSKYRIIVCGGRDTYVTEDEMLRVLNQWDTEEVIIVHGGARGVDIRAGEVAAKFGFEVEVYPAQWNRYGKRAGYLRNIQMADLDNVNEVVAFPGGVGTKMMVDIAKKRGIPVQEVFLVGHEG